MTRIAEIVGIIFKNNSITAVISKVNNLLGFL